MIVFNSTLVSWRFKIGNGAFRSKKSPRPSLQKGEKPAGRTTCQSRINHRKERFGTMGVSVPIPREAVDGFCRRWDIAHSEEKAWRNFFQNGRSY